MALSSKVTKALAKLSKQDKNGLFSSEIAALETALDGVADKEALKQVKAESKAVKAGNKYYNSAFKASSDKAYAEAKANEAKAATEAGDKAITKAEIKNINANIKAVKAAVKSGASEEYVQAVMDSAEAGNAKVFAQLTKQLKKGKVSDSDAVKLAKALDDAEGLSKADVKELVAALKKGNAEAAIDKVEEIVKGEEGGDVTPDPEAPATFKLTYSKSVHENEAAEFVVTASKPVEEDTEVTFTVRAADATAADQNQDGKTNLNDFGQGTLTTVTVVIKKGETTASHAVTAIDDGKTESDEVYFVDVKVNGKELETAGVTVKDGQEGGGQTFMLTKGLDNYQGTAGNDTIIGSIDTAAGNVEMNTISSLDLVNGGAGVDTLKIATADTNATVTLPNLSNVEIIELQGSGTTGKTTLAAKSVAGLTDINVTKMAEDVKVEAAATTNVNVSMQAAAGETVEVDGGNNVTVKLTDVVDTGGAENDITIGTGFTAPKGAVIVEATAKAAADNVDVVMGKIDITGGKTISVTQKVGSASALVAGGTSPDHTQGDVAIAADATTTTVTVKQDLAATKNNGVLAVAGVKEVVSVKFAALGVGETLSLTDGTNALTFTATVAMSAAEVAAAFSNLNADAVLPTGATGDTQGSQIAAKGVFSDDGLDDWSSAAAVGDTVVFTAKTAGTTGLADNGGTKTATLTTTTAGLTAVPGVAPVLGVKVGDVQIAGGAALATVTVDSYKTSSDITGGANNALATVNLSNGADFDIASAAATLALNLTNVTGTVDVQAGTTTLNATVATNSTTAATLKSATATAVNVSGTGLVAGTTAAGGLTAATAINTTGMTAGNATFTIADGTKTTYTGGAATDNVTVTNGGTAITKAIDLGAGNDTLKLDGTVVVPTATLKGGEGTDTLSMNVASAAARDGDTLFKAKLDSFERLTLNNNALGGSNVTIDLENLGFTNYVTTSGTDANVLTLDKMASGGTVVLTNTTAAAGIAVAVKDAATGTADVLNVVARVDAADIDHGLLTVANVETINITAEDISPLDALGADDIKESTLTLKADKVTSVKVDGNADLELILDPATVKLATIDAGTLTGDLTVAAIGNVGLTITGGSGDDTLSASVGATAKTDVISGGAGNDIIVAGSNGGNGAFLTGGDGNDLFVLTAAAADEGSKDANSYYMITDFQAGDLLQLGWYDITGTATALASSFTKLDTNLNDNTASFDSFVTAAMAQIKAENEATWTGAEVSGTDDALGKAIYFNYKGNAYVVVDSGVSTTGAFTGTEDLVIQLTGINSDNLSFNSDYATVALI